MDIVWRHLSLVTIGTKGLKQYFGLNFRRLKVKQEPKSREYHVCKRINFLRLPTTNLNKIML